MQKRALLLSLPFLLTACAPKAPSLPQDSFSQVAPTSTPQAVPPVQEQTLQYGSASAQPAAKKLGEPQKNKEQVMVSATISTTKGDIVVELYPDKAPGTVSNFEAKSASGYYNNLTFHRVEDWVIQGGDPKGNGTGGGSMPTELSDEPFVEGSLGVARGGDIKVSNDSQFFICTTDCNWLTGQYTNFGKVTKGMDVAKKMEIGDKILKITTTEK